MELMNNSMPKLAVVIPNYNGGENLKRAIESCGTIKIPENDYEILKALRSHG